MADQAMYHQGNQSVFVGGRLWTLLPPPAEINYGELIHENHEKIEVLHLFRCVTHTHMSRYAGSKLRKVHGYPQIHGAKFRGAECSL